ncbi:peptidoglycan DD-metalloendopeptidase family protein [Planktotalea arctica]|uniref:peptidoglycan DD-metalloendopeptidase family protein n=1 Tax=Planktotalea arctica TaxID=1481893 RepID=UPI000A17815F|nr:peptidoglycan DD-metalloendopeptidase family protein [Planktotalea arctica]
MTIFASSTPLRALLCGTAFLALSACEDGFDLDMRGGLGNKFDTTDAAINATQARPSPDARGVITYSNYQVAVAQRGDSVADVAARIGVDAEELARYNGLSSSTKLRKDEVLALRNPVSTLPGDSTGTAPAPGAVDITALAQGAIDSSPVTTSALPAAAAAGPEPVRHRVARGETAFTIARLYNVSVRSLADWNGLDKDFSVREGQYLLIPVAQNQASAAPAPLAATTSPGTGTPTPTPPSATQPLPQEETPVAAAPIETPPAPELEKPTKAVAAARMGFPVQGPIVREYTKGKNDGIGIGASAGTPVKAAAAGTVAAITENTDNLPIIVVKHPNNLLTVYANVDGLKVKKGDSVARGQQLAAVRAGSSDFLHFEVRKGFDSVDPLPYLQ